MTTTTKDTALKGVYTTADHKAQIEWELEPKENGMEFSASGTFDGGGGQNIDRIARAYPSDKMVQRIAAVWSEWHLNGMNAGTPEQMRALEEEKAKAVNQALAMPNPERFFWDFERRELNPHTLGHVAGLKEGDYYTWACHVLKQRGLYEVILSDDIKATGGFPAEVQTISDVAQWRESSKTGGLMYSGINSKQAAALSDLDLLHRLGKRGYRYGERWVFRPIPADVVDEIRSWKTGGDTRPLQEIQTEEFLARHDIKFSALIGSKKAQWEPAGHYYEITLNAYRPHVRRVRFDFWDSAHNKSKGISLTAGSVVSCIASDIDTPETFEEFCSAYGEDPDSRKALATFKRCAEHADKLRAFFTEEEISELRDLRG